MVWSAGMQAGNLLDISRTNSLVNFCPAEPRGAVLAPISYLGGQVLRSHQP